MNTLLVPIDFSAASANALNYAAQLCKATGDALVLFHAYMLPTPVSEVPYIMVTAEEMQKENEQLMQQEVSRIRTTHGVRAETVVRLGIPSDEVKNYIHEHPVAMVVMGMKGAGGMDKIMGSTTTNVIRKIKTPVLVVPHDAAYSPLNSITYAADLSHPVHFKWYEPLFRLSAPFASVFHLVHIQTQHTSEGADRLMTRKEIEQAFHGHPHDFSIVENPSVTHGVNEHLLKHPSDLLVMVAHKHGLLEQLFTKNHTAAMAYETHTPLLILQNKD